jgi:hypothetical protein
VFIPSAIGMALGIGVFGTLSDKLVTRNLNSGAVHRPEIRLTPYFTLPAGLTLPIGLFIYGWTIQYHVHWIVPMIGVVIFAFGLMGVMVRPLPDCATGSTPLEPNLKLLTRHNRCACKTISSTSTPPPPPPSPPP